jgi:hypothetical protein
MTQADEPVGSAAEEAVKLFSAFATHAAEAASRAGHGFEEHLATGAPECTYCPLCRTVHIAREASPEVRLHLASAAASLMQAAASVLNAVASSGPSAGERTGGVERIDLDEPGVWPDEPSDQQTEQQSDQHDQEENER